ncbi:hypothetical protein B0I00_3333 [Novosphingobium kunmingense]|uniref:Uncharacterized protein n=1 Tax=Novosphingobium kunmingense TaxID=1211806 RepID=A0A2N0H2X5_9SPHN|nr:hypothetical protein [Novosphingobium kunmingense]PKB13296.1 hypothetical protein B0I00_3333 [Novosphingobium kunmingense]
MGSKRLDLISDYARHGFNLRVDCRACRHTAVLNARELTDTCSKRGWSRVMAAVEARLKCRKCGSRDVRCGPSFG